MNQNLFSGARSQSGGGSVRIDRVYLDYRKPTQRPLDRVTAEEIERHHRAGQFPPGNMGPKIESALRFLREGGREVIITSFERIPSALRGEAGTTITASRPRGL